MIDNENYTMNNYMQFFIKLQLELNNDTRTIIMHIKVDKIEGKRRKIFNSCGHNLLLAKVNG
jgi:hypothetical protein